MILRHTFLRVTTNSITAKRFCFFLMRQYCSLHHYPVGIATQKKSKKKQIDRFRYGIISVFLFNARSRPDPLDYVKSHPHKNLFIIIQSFNCIVMSFKINNIFIYFFFESVLFVSYLFSV